MPWHTLSMGRLHAPSDGLLPWVSVYRLSNNPPRGINGCRCWGRGNAWSSIPPSNRGWGGGRDKQFYWGAGVLPFGTEKSLFGGKQNETGLSTENFPKISNAFYLVFTGMIRKSLLCTTCFFKLFPCSLMKHAVSISGKRWNRCSFHWKVLKCFQIIDSSCLIYLLKIYTVPFGGKFSPDFPR